MAVAPTPLNFVNVIPEEIQDLPEDDSGQDYDVVVDRPQGKIYVKLNGTWEQVFPALIT